MESFKNLSKSEKESYLDNKMILLQQDMIDAKEAGNLFIELDSEHKFENILLMLILYPNEMTQFYDLTSPVLDYNIKHWDGIFSNADFFSKNEVSADSLMYDIIHILFGYRYMDSEISKLLKMIFFNGDGRKIKDKYLQLRKKLHG